MKIVSLLSVLVVAVCLTGCEDPELVTCQQEKNTLQNQLDRANTAITEKDIQIEALKAENTETQTKAMESITVMMTKQAEKDKQLKQKLVEKDQQAQALKRRFASLQVEHENLKGLYENATASLDSSMQEKESLRKQLEKAQKAAAAATEAAPETATETATEAATEAP